MIYSYALDGRPFPDDHDLYQILNSMPDDVKSLFVAKHIRTMAALVANLNDQYDENQVVEAIYNHVGLSFSKLQGAFFIQAYFREIFSGFIGNPRNIYELMLPRSDKTLEKLQPNVSNIDANLDRFTSFRNPHLVVGLFAESLKQGLFGIDPVLQAWVTKFNELRKYGAYSDSQKWLTLDKKDSLPTAQCGFCGTIFVFDRGWGITKAPPHCGEPSCEKAHDRERQASVRAKQKPANEWVAVFEKRRDCKGCGMRRKVNLEGLCRVCFSCDRKARYPIRKFALLELSRPY